VLRVAYYIKWRQDYSAKSWDLNSNTPINLLKGKNMQRPTSVTVFGILNIVFAALGIIGVLCTAVLFVVLGTNPNNPAFQNNPTFEIIQNSPAYAAWLKLSIVLGLLSSAALLAAGIGLFYLKPWARMLSIVYGIYGIVLIIVNTVVSYFFLIQPMLQKAHEAQGPEGVGAAIGGAVGGMCGGCLGIIYPILLLIFMLRPNVTAAFHEQLQPPGGNYPGV
jgi:hypothetical protein